MRPPERTGFCSFLCLIECLLVKIFVSIKMNGRMHSENLSVKISYGCCSTLHPDRLIRFVVGVTFSRIDLVHLGLAVWTSGSMVLYLLGTSSQSDAFAVTADLRKSEPWASSWSSRTPLSPSTHCLLVCLFGWLYFRPVADGHLCVFVFFPGTPPLCVHLQLYRCLGFVLRALASGNLSPGAGCSVARPRALTWFPQLLSSCWCWAPFPTQNTDFFYAYI